jgi:hypothetical protein
VPATAVVTATPGSSAASGAGVFSNKPTPTPRG